MSKSVYVSPSTQENNLGAGNYGTEEYRMNQVADVVVKELKRHGITVYRNRPEMSLGQVVDDSNAKDPTLHFAIHSNAGGNGKARGGEVFCHKFGGTGEKMARNVYAELEALTPVSDRGVKEGYQYYGPGKPMYELAYTKAPAALVEIDFHDNPDGAAWIISHIEAIGVAITKGLLKTLGIAFQQEVKLEPKPEPVKGTPILSKATATVKQAQAWAKKNGATEQFIKNAETYWNLAPVCGGVDPAGAYVQSAKESGFGHHRGVVPASYCNPCGLKTTQGGGNDDVNAHQKFNNWEVGIAAHLDHAALYAGAKGYPKAGTPDPRHFAFIKGTAPTWEALGGKWAPSATYGEDIVKMLKALQATPEPKEPTPQEIAVDAALEAGLISDREHWLQVLNGQQPANPEYLTIAFTRAKGLRKG